MTASHISGPSVVYGEVTSTASTSNNPEAGPSVTYQGDSILDVRFPYDPGVTGKGRIRAFSDAPYICFVDAVPTAAGAAKVAPAATGTSGVVLPLASVLAAGIMPNSPILPVGALAPAGIVKVLAVDPGFTTCTTVAGSAVITPVNIALFARFQPGLNVAVAGGAGNTWVFATVLSVAATTITLSVSMGVTSGGVAIALANGSLRNDDTPTYVTQNLSAGVALLYDARSGLSRGVSVTSNNAADTGWTVTVRGYDVHSYPVTETITVTANGIAYGNKSFRFIASVTPFKSGGGVSTGTFSVGISDLFGFIMRSDAWEYLNIYYAGAFLSVSTGYQAADLTTPATATTGHVRGRIQVSAAGPGGTFAAGGAPDGTKRLTMYMSLPVDNLVAAKGSNPAPLYGVTQFAG